MEKSKIINPIVKDVWNRSIWTGQPNSLGLSPILSFFAVLAIWLGCGYVSTLFIDIFELRSAVVYAVYIVAFILFYIFLFSIFLKTSHYKMPQLMFAIADDRIFFTNERYATSTEKRFVCFSASTTNITSFKRKNNGGKTTVIINFAERTYMGAYGKIKALPLYRISNVEQLISILTDLGIKEEKKQP
jgi:hypothetical protein